MFMLLRHANAFRGQKMRRERQENHTLDVQSYTQPTIPSGSRLAIMYQFQWGSPLKNVLIKSQYKVKMNCSRCFGLVSYIHSTRDLFTNEIIFDIAIINHH